MVSFLVKDNEGISGEHRAAGVVPPPCVKPSLVLCLQVQPVDRLPLLSHPEVKTASLHPPPWAQSSQADLLLREETHCRKAGLAPQQKKPYPLLEYTNKYVYFLK